MRIVAIIFGILAAIVDLILVIVSIAVPEVSLWGWIVVLTIVTVGLFFSANKVKKQKEARQAAQVARNTPFMEETAISAIAQGELPVVTGTPVLLEEGEVAHYYAPATKIVTKNKAVGRTGSGAGVRVRVAKGVSVSTGGGSSRTVYGEVTETYSGAIVLTNIPVCQCSDQVHSEFRFHDFAVGADQNYILRSAFVSCDDDSFKHFSNSHFLHF